MCFYTTDYLNSTTFVRCETLPLLKTHSSLEWNIVFVRTRFGRVWWEREYFVSLFGTPSAQVSPSIRPFLQQLIQSGDSLTGPAGEDTPHIWTIQPFTAGQMLQAFSTARSHCQIPGTDPKHRCTSVPSPRQRLMQLRAYSCIVQHCSRASDRPVYSFKTVTHGIHITDPLIYIKRT